MIDERTQHVCGSTCDSIARAENEYGSEGQGHVSLHVLHLGYLCLIVDCETQGRVGSTAQRECPIFCVTAFWSMLPKRSKDDDNFQGITGRTAEGL